MTISSIVALRRGLARTDEHAEAVRFTENLIADFEHDRDGDSSELSGADDVFDGSYTYDFQHGVAEKFMLAGGNPTVYAVFVSFSREGRELTAFVDYYDGEATHCIPIPSYIAFELRKALRRDRKAQEARR